MTAIDDFVKNATDRMDKSVEATHEHFNSVRTGRATPALLDRITIDYYGTPTPLKNLATINTPEPRMLTIQPFDPSSIKQIAKTIQDVKHARHLGAPQCIHLTLQTATHLFTPRTLLAPLTPPRPTQPLHPPY